MYRVTTKNPLYEYKYLLTHNKSRLSLLELCYGIGLLTGDEYMGFRTKAIKGELK